MTWLENGLAIDCLMVVVGCALVGMRDSAAKANVLHAKTLNANRTDLSSPAI